MKTSTRTALLAIAIGSSVVLAGCVGSSEDERSEVSIGSNERTAGTDALGVAIVVDGDGNGRVVGTLINTTQEAQTLVGADVDTERGPAQAAVIEDEVPLPAGQPVELAREPAISVSAADLPVGLFIELTFDIEGADPIDMLVPVEAQEGPYEEVEVTEVPDGDISPN